MSDVWLALVAFGAAQRDQAIGHLHRVAARIRPGARVRGVVVDNALEGDFERELDDGVTLISGDNRAREFSGWDRGLAWLESAHRLRGDDLILVGNDTLHRSYGRAWLDGFSPAHDGDGLAGWLDAYPREVRLFGLPLDRWVRTNLFTARVRTLDRLRPLRLWFSDEQLFHGATARFCEPSPLDARYRRYLATWLWGEPGEPEFVERWHSAAPLSAENAPAFRAKIRSILCEHHLSARARSLGLPLAGVSAAAA
jgi:hypothetical protein